MRMLLVCAGLTVVSALFDGDAFAAVPVPVIGKKTEKRLHVAEDEASYVAVPYTEDMDTIDLRSGQVAGHVLMPEGIAINSAMVRCICILDDAMNPGLPRGSIVAVDLGRTDPGLADGHIVAARRGDDGIVIKRWRSYDPHVVMLTSDSPDQAAYSPLRPYTRRRARRPGRLGVG